MMYKTLEFFMLFAGCVVKNSDSILKQQDHHPTKESVDFKDKQTKYLDLVRRENDPVFNQSAKR